LLKKGNDFVKTIDRSVRDETEILELLRGEAKLSAVAIDEPIRKKIEEASNLAAKSLGVLDLATVDEQLAKVVHAELAPLRKSTPWLLNDPRFWEWLAFNPCRGYALERWCEGDGWLPEATPETVPTGLKRLTIKADSVKHHARHAVRRLYIYADCSYSYDASYNHVSEILEADLDISGAVFERRLGLAPLLALLLIRVASKFSATKKGPSSKGISAREKRRDFFKQVNMLAATVALEYLDEATLSDYLEGIAADIA
jgi:hypothetical protein